MTRAVFDTQMERLAGLKFPPADLQTHWEALQDLPDPLLDAAVSTAQREAYEFPSPAAIRAIADRVRPQVLPLPPPAREWKNYCEDCQDTGWRSWRCGEETRMPWLDECVRACGRTFDHSPHEWVSPCPCIDTNPTIQRRRERSAQLAAQRTRGGHER